MNKFNAEELFVAGILLLSEAVAFIAQSLMRPVAQAMRTALGWKPASKPRPQPRPHPVPVPVPAVSDETEEDDDDSSNDYSREVPTAEERSPSLWSS